MAVDTKKLLALLQKHYKNTKTILTYGNDFELMIAVILSAQCTDIAVNKVTDKLFPKFRSLKFKIQNVTEGDPRTKLQEKIKMITPEIQEIINFAEVPREELAQDIKSTGFYNNKAKSVQEAARTILEKFDGKLPHTLDEMTTIPGVARKTGNVVLGNAFGIVEGIAVDTHVKKQSQRFGLTTNTDPNKIEQDLMKQFDKKDWFSLTYLLIEHGRTIRFKKDKNCEVCKGDCELEKMALFTAK